MDKIGIIHSIGTMPIWSLILMAVVYLAPILIAIHRFDDDRQGVGLFFFNLAFG